MQNYNSQTPSRLTRFFRSIWVYLKAHYLFFLRHDSILKNAGWIETEIRGYPCTKKGYPLPWINYGAIHLLKQRLTKDLTLFEYGSGYSTIFFARRVQSVTSVEYDETWFKKLELIAPQNVRLIFQPYSIDDPHYFKIIATTSQKYDVIVVDGRDRVNCIKFSLDYLTGSGVVLLDDSSRERYTEAFHFLHQQGFKTLDIRGLKPGLNNMSQTTIAYRENNCLGL